MIDLASHIIWYIQYLWGPLVEWSRKKKETEEEHDENFVEEGFQLATIKLDRNGMGGSTARGKGNRPFSR